MLYFGLSWARSSDHGQWARFQDFRNDGNLMRLSIARSSWRERSFCNNRNGGCRVVQSAEVGREKGSCRDWDKRVELQSSV